MEALDRILVVLTHELLGGEPPKLVVSKVVSFAGAAVRELVPFNIWVCLPFCMPFLALAIKHMAVALPLHQLFDHVEKSNLRSFFRPYKALLYQMVRTKAPSGRPMRLVVDGTSQISTVAAASCEVNAGTYSWGRASHITVVLPLLGRSSSSR